MGPNLTRLFDETKDGSPFAPVILGELFAEHGEALIAALEKLANEAAGFNALVGPDVIGYTNKQVLATRIAIARSVLAQLESEAHSGT